MMSIFPSFSKSIHSAFLQISLTRFTLLFFLLGLVFAVGQGVMQAFLFTGDASASSFVSEILQVGHVPTGHLPWLTRNGGTYTLRLCAHTPGSWNNGSEPCVTIFENGNITSSNATIPAGYRRSGHLLPDLAGYSLEQEGMGLSPALDQTGNIIGVNMSYSEGTQSVFLSNQCTRVLLYPAQVFRNSRTESLALVALQVWLFGMTVCALVSESIPHVLAIFSMRILSVAWSAYTIWRTEDIEDRFEHLVIDQDSACQFNLFAGYFPFRISLQIPDLVLNCVALLLTAYLGWNLIKAFNEHTFKRVGPPPNIVRLYRYLLAVLVCLHLCLYLTVAAMGLWVEQLLHSAVAAISSHTKVYLALFIYVIITLVPWIFMTMYAIRREKKVIMAVSTAVCISYIGAWSAMFDSQVYRWTWIQWPFFASCTISAFISLIASGMSGAICWCNFDSGLAHYLHVEEVLANSDFEPDAFTTQAETSQDVKSLTFEAVGRGRPFSLVKKDSNWNFHDVETQRPSIYVVELQDERREQLSPIYR